MINNVRAKPVQDLECSINSQVAIGALDELENKSKKLLPDCFILEFVHTSLDLDQNIS